MRAAILAIFLASCAANEEQAASEVTPKGACTYSWQSVGTWTTWCYNDDTQAGCDARDTQTGFSVWLQGSTCQALGYTQRCQSGLYKNTTCKWYE